MNQIKAGVVLNYVIIGLNALVGLLYTPYMLRMMGQSEYGLYSLVTSVIAYLTIMDFGFGNAVIRYTARFRAQGKTQEQSEMFGMFMVLYTVIGFLALIAGLVLYLNVDAMFGNTMTANELDKARIMMLILTFNLAVTFPFSIYNSIITAYEDFVFQKLLNVIRIILNTVVMICLLKMGYKAIAMVIVHTVFNLLTLLLNYIYCKHKLKVKFIYRKFKWGFLKEVAIYSFWIFLNAIMDKIYWGTGQFVLGAVSGTTAISIFAVGITLSGMYMSFSTAISSVFLPKVSAMVAKNSSEKEISDLFIRTGRIQYIVMAFILSGFIIFPACFSYGVQPDSGPGLVFISLVSVFSNMAYGQVWGAVFFLFMLFASVSTLIAVFENIIAICMEIFDISRVKSVVYNCIVIILLGIPCLLGYNLWSDIQPLGAGSTILDTYDFILSKNILPYGTLCYILYVVLKRGWGFDNYLKEANTGIGIKIPLWALNYYKFVLPVVIVVLFLQGYVEIFGK